MNIVCVVGHAVDDFVELDPLEAWGPVEVNVVLFVLSESFSGFANGENGDFL